MHFKDYDPEQLIYIKIIERGCKTRNSNVKIIPNNKLV